METGQGGQADKAILPNLLLLWSFKVRSYNIYPSTINEDMMCNLCLKDRCIRWIRSLTSTLRSVKSAVRWKWLILELVSAGLDSVAGYSSWPQAELLSGISLDGTYELDSERYVPLSLYWLLLSFLSSFLWPRGNVVLSQTQEDSPLPF